MIMMGKVSVGPAYYIGGRNNRETSRKRFLKGLFRRR
jgi:hypothetical protein